MTPLHWIGDNLRELLLGIPLPAVRAAFVALPLALLIWVLFLPAQQTRPPSGRHAISGNLKLWSVVALAIQVAIYIWLG